MATVLEFLLLMFLIPSTAVGDTCNNIVLKFAQLLELVERQKQSMEQMKRNLTAYEERIEQLEGKVKGRGHQQDNNKGRNQGVFFSVGLKAYMAFPLAALYFDKIITNVGGCYIGNSSNVDYGKFVVPENGTYLFTASVHSQNWLVGADLYKNNVFITSALNYLGGGSGSLTAILDLQEGDEVYLRRPSTTASGRLYYWAATSFTGVLLR